MNLLLSIFMKVSFSLNNIEDMYYFEFSHIAVV